MQEELGKRRCETKRAPRSEHMSLTCGRALPEQRGRLGRFSVVLALGLAGASVLACGGDDAVTVDAVEDRRSVGPLTELPILEGYNHASETSIAARDGQVVVVFINQILADATSFESASLPDFRRVGVMRSADHGETFTSHVGLAPAEFETSDPLVRVDGQGVFWAVAIDADADNAKVWSSADGGETFSELSVELPVWDKEWMVIDDDDDVLFVQGAAGIIKFDRQGTVIAEAAYDSGTGRNATGGYAHDGSAYFLTMARRVIGWDGMGEPAQVGPQFYSGDRATMFTVCAGAIGATPNGQHWIVRSIHASTGSPVLLGVGELPGGPYVEQAVTPEDAVTFLPAAVQDEEGRLHVTWYDSSGDKGVLRYTHSLSTNLTEGFLPPIVVDGDACPGRGWYPHSSSDLPPGGRRLREYIDIAVDGSRAHIAWTHAPEAPSRVFATYIDF